ncbi:O-antigen translocase [Vibrio fluvialis]|uniref:O-antigen translocase n=1 Tax=Vibrio fluvialis TaxID=676 RepID=UPI0024DFEB85|nr:O-antigen translocase [Vibrio fluvialis]WIE03920.1 O-antigen translocase [Vibrio fluvialis]
MIVNKTIAVLAGPSGLVLVAQFQNFIQVAYSLSKLGINGGVTKLTAQFVDNESKLNQVWFTALIISVISSTLVSLSIFLCSDFFSELVFNNVDYAFLFISLSISIVFVVLNSLYLSIINGQQKILKFIKINIYQSLLTLFVTIILSYVYGLPGALFSLSINQSVIFFLLLMFDNGYKDILKINKINRIYNKVIGRELSKYSTMVLLSSILLPLTHTYIRGLLVDGYSEHLAGVWQGVNYLSLTFITLITSSFSVYYLPRVSGKGSAIIRNELKSTYKLIIPVSILSVFTIYISRDLIIYILFTSEFEVMRDLFLWQFLGDLVRINVFPLSYLLVSKADSYKYICSETILYGAYALLVFFSILFDPASDLIDVSFFYFCSCLAYALFVVSSTRKYI